VLGGLGKDRILGGEGNDILSGDEGAANANAGDADREPSRMREVFESIGVADSVAALENVLR